MKCLQNFLGDYYGLVQTDGYGVYESFARGNEKVTLIGCWAHMRRKFYKPSKKAPSWPDGCCN